jgi:hypothetical protein
LREHDRRLGAIHLDRRDPTGVHHGQVGSQPGTDLCIGAAQRMLPEFPRQ